MLDILHVIFFSIFHVLEKKYRIIFCNVVNVMLTQE